MENKAKRAFSASRYRAAMCR